ncbi:MAG: RdgB/HAM1 family non-canonical purine NTP pyrophosphatase [Candidatus Binatia bacterium]
MTALLIATGNAGKRREYDALLGDLGLRLGSLADYPAAPAVAESGETYLANARLKAVSLAAFARLPALADDSGLEVDALGGAPGVHSARYAALAMGRSGSADDQTNCRFLLGRLRGRPQPPYTARFRCVIVVAHPDGRELVADGACEGRIVETPRGDGGFGYDPIFFYPPLARTFAELSAAEKDRISHRALAVAALRPTLLDWLAAD